jgi:hypothetical protein
MGGLLTMYALRSIWDFLSMLIRAYSLSSSHSFSKLDSEKKERLIPQTPSIRGRNHSYLGDTTTYGGFNGKVTITLSFNQGQEKNDTLW